MTEYEEPQKGESRPCSREYTRKVSAVRLAVDELMMSQYEITRPEVRTRIRILQLLLSKEPRLEFPKLHKHQMMRETCDVSRHVIYDVVGYAYSMASTTAHFVLLATGIAEVRIPMTVLL